MAGLVYDREDYVAGSLGTVLNNVDVWRSADSQKVDGRVWVMYVCCCPSSTERALTLSSSYIHGGGKQLLTQSVDILLISSLLQLGEIR